MSVPSYLRGVIARCTIIAGSSLLSLHIFIESLEGRHSNTTTIHQSIRHDKMAKSDETTRGKPKDPQSEGLYTNSETAHETTAGANTDEEVYPPMAKVLPVMLAIYLVFFIVALVGSRR
jgi:hypothetical protein